MHRVRRRGRARPQSATAFVGRLSFRGRRYPTLRRIFARVRNRKWTPIFETAKSGRWIISPSRTDLRDSLALPGGNFSGSSFLPFADSLLPRLSTSVNAGALVAVAAKPITQPSRSSHAELELDCDLAVNVHTSSYKAHRHLCGPTNVKRSEYRHRSQ